MTEIEDQEEYVRVQARYEHLEFMAYCWQRHKDFKIGVHTTAICDEIDEAFEKYRQGISVFLIILVCHRQGKSEIVSRFLPAHFLGEFPDDEVILTSHNVRLAYKFSRFSRSVVKSMKFNELYPGVKLSREKAGVEEWGIEGTQGIAQFFGSLTDTGSSGLGGNLIVIDDYLGNRADAESELIREKLWDGFTNNIWTRRNNPCIFLITVTPWHVDDIVGRIKEEMKADKDYPKFKIIKFPYKRPSYKTRFLFPQMYPDSWYLDMAKVLGEYGESSLMLCDPTVKTGNMLRTDKINYYDSEDELPKDLIWVRGWDLASSKKEKMKSDPDFTVGVKLAIKRDYTNIVGIDIITIYIDDVIRGQWEATKRNEIIIATTIADGFIRCGIEAFAAYKDAYTELYEILKGIRHIEKMQLPGDKVSKASPLVPIFQAGNVYMRKADWNAPFNKVIKEFPSGKHDDDADAMTVGYHMAMTGGMSLYTAADAEASIDKSKAIIELALQRVQDKQTVGCTLKEYRDGVREALLKEAKDRLEVYNNKDMHDFIMFEVSRLDDVFDYMEAV